MKKTSTLVALLWLGMTSALATAPPYSSNFFENYTTDDGWTTENNGDSGSKSWQFDTSSAYIAAGKTGGAMKAYDYDYDADCWMFSPTITLQAGTTYTMSVLAQTKGSDSEALEIKLGKEASSTSMGSGQELYRNDALINPNSYTTITLEFTVAETGDYHFGFHCFSEANHYVLYLTGFSVTAGESGGDPGTDPDPSEPQAIPWEETFETEPVGWTFVNGDGTSVSDTWAYNIFNKTLTMDYAYDMQEDHWAISPAINFAEAGTYAIETSGSVYGKLAYKLGTDAADLSSFSQTIGTQECNEYDHNDKFVFDVTTPGTYHVAIHACAETGTYMGYRINSIAVKTQKKLLVNINDLTVQAFENPAKAELSATYPSVYNNGEVLDLITKAEIMRDDEVIETLYYPAPGYELSYTDFPPQPGTYIYSVKVYGKDDAEPDESPMQVKSGYVGKPYMDIPSETVTLKDLPEADKDKWLLGGWQFSYYSLVSEAGDDGTVDHTLASPYVHLEPGDYRLTLNLKGLDNGYKVVLCSDRTDLSANTVEILDCANETEQGYFDKKIIFTLEQAGDFAIAINHYRSNTSYWSNTMEIFTMKLAPVMELPQAVTGLEGLLNEECTEATLTWTNPTNTNLGSDIDGELTIKVMRDDEVIATLKGEAGKSMTYTDQTVEDHAKHLYGIIVANANGDQEDEVPTIELNFEVAAKYPYVADFHDWNIPGYGNWWEVGEDGYLKFREASSGYSDYAVSPLVKFDADEKYEVTAVFENSTASLNMRFGNSEDGDDHMVIYQFPAPASEAEEAMKMVISCAAAGEPETTGAKASSDGSDEENPSLATVSMTPSKGHISMNMASEGHICMKSFSIVKLGTSEAGMETIFATGESIGYANGTAYLPEASESFIVTDITGAILLNGHSAGSIDLTPYSGTLIISVRTADGLNKTLKVIR